MGARNKRIRRWRSPFLALQPSGGRTVLPHRFFSAKKRDPGLEDRGLGSFRCGVALTVHPLHVLVGLGVHQNLFVLLDEQGNPDGEARFGDNGLGGTGNGVATDVVLAFGHHKNHLLGNLHVDGLVLPDDDGILLALLQVVLQVLVQGLRNGHGVKAWQLCSPEGLF